MAGSRKRPGAEAPPDALVRAVEDCLRQHAKPGSSVTVGLSGGIDSIVLLDVLRDLAPRLGLRLDALHINHGLSPNADHWEHFCRRHCGRRRISFQAVRVEVAGEGVNVEEEARRARYRGFASHGAEVMALAHNRDDQAETVLLRLLRGAGVQGLAGMPEMRSMCEGASAEAGGQRLIRPLLGVSRAAIRAHALRRRLTWMEDESNADPRFARNFLRAEILPVLERRFPGCTSALVRAAAHMREAGALLEAFGEADLQAVMVAGHLDVKKLAALGQPRAASVLRLALAAHGEPPPTAAATHEVLRQLLTAAVDANPEVALANVVLRRYRGRVGIAPIGHMADARTWQHVAWSGEGEQRLPDGSVLRVRETVGTGVARARLAAGSTSLRRRRGGERMRLRADGPSRTLKNLLQEGAVPPWERDAMPLLYCNEQLVWVPAVGVASEFQARPGEPALEFCWEPV